MHTGFELWKIAEGLDARVFAFRSKLWCESCVSETREFVDLDLSLTLIHPTSTCTHWATLRHHPCLSRADTSASSQLSLIICRSLLTALVQFARGRPGPLLYPGTSQCNACCGMRWWSIRITCLWSKPVKSSFSQYVVRCLFSSSSCRRYVCWGQKIAAGSTLVYPSPAMHSIITSFVASYYLSRRTYWSNYCHVAPQPCNKSISRKNKK